MTMDLRLKNDLDKMVKKSRHSIYKPQVLPINGFQMERINKSLDLDHIKFCSMNMGDQLKLQNLIIDHMDTLGAINLIENNSDDDVPVDPY